MSTFFSFISSSLSSAVSIAVDATSNALIGVFSFLPAGETFPDAVHQSAQTFGGYLSLIDFIVPAQTLIFIMGLIVGTEIILLGFRFLMKIAYFIRGSAQ